MATIKIRGGEKDLEFRATDMPMSSIRARFDLYNVFPREMEVMVDEDDVPVESQGLYMTRYDIVKALKAANKPDDEAKEIADKIVGNDFEIITEANNEIQERIDPIIAKINAIGKQLTKLLEQRGEEIADIILETNKKYNKRMWDEANKHLKD